MFALLFVPLVIGTILNHQIYLRLSVKKIVWEETVKEYVDDSMIKCGFRCNNLGASVCTGIAYDEQTKTCRLGKAETIPLPLQPENTGLVVNGYYRHIF